MAEMRRVPVSGKKSKRGTVPHDAGTAGDSEPTGDCSCPVLEAAEWHEVESEWSDIAFVRGSLTAVVGVPVGYADAREALLKRARKMGAEIPGEPMFLLGSGRFRRRILLEVEGVARGVRGVVFPGGIAFSRLLEAPWGEMRRAVDETVAVARARYGRKPDEVFVWYLTCRQCSRARNFETLVVAHYRQAP